MIKDQIPFLHVGSDSPIDALKISQYNNKQQSPVRVVASKQASEDFQTGRGQESGNENDDNSSGPYLEQSKNLKSNREQFIQALRARYQSQHQNANSSLLKRLIGHLLRGKKEQKLDTLEAMINENTLRLLQQKDLLFRQNASLQLDELCKITKFTRRELKWLYTGWKVACTEGCGVSTDTEGLESYGTHSLSSAYYGIINEAQFQQIYAQFFPYGGDCSFYAKYVFQAMFGDHQNKNGGFITFSDYALALSSLLRGSIEEKISFVFRLYDLNNDNVLTLDEISRIFNAVYRLLGDNVNKRHDQMTYDEQAEKFYRKLDTNDTGYITKEQFEEFCLKDSMIIDTIRMLEMSICSNK